MFSNADDDDAEGRRPFFLLSLFFSSLVTRRHREQGVRDGSILTFASKDYLPERPLRAFSRGKLW